MANPYSQSLRISWATWLLFGMCWLTLWLTDGWHWHWHCILLRYSMCPSVDCMLLCLLNSWSFYARKQHSNNICAFCVFINQSNLFFPSVHALRLQGFWTKTQEATLIFSALQLLSCKKIVKCKVKREITRHGSHNITCLSAAVIFPSLTQPKLVLGLTTPKGCKAELT